MSEKQDELMERELTELADFNWLARKSLIRLEESIDYLQGIEHTLLRLESKIDNIERQTIKEEKIN